MRTPSLSSLTPKTFSATGNVVKTSVRTIYSLDIVKNGENIDFYVCGNGFLYNMVRIIGGTLMLIGRGKYEPDYIVNMLEAKDRAKAGCTAPPEGLTLMNIEFI